jgi:hypothetical protein
MLLFLLTRIGFPVMIAVGAIAAWRMSKAEHAPGATQPEWKDDSLDDWRQERDAAAEAERAARGQTSRSDIEEGSTEEKEQAKRHQRIGG